MDKFLNNILHYDKIIIFSDQHSDEISWLLYNILERGLIKEIELHEKLRILNNKNYKIRDFYYDYEEYDKKLKRFLPGLIKNYMIRIRIKDYVKGSGRVDSFVIEHKKFHKMWLDSDVGFMCMDNECRVIGDQKGFLIKDDKQYLNLDEIRRVYKIGKILNNINNGDIS